MPSSGEPAQPFAGATGREATLMRRGIERSASLQAFKHQSQMAIGPSCLQLAWLALWLCPTWS
jgi:hypothetical protein